MTNMSHCRFHNTTADLADCIDEVERRMNGVPVDEDGDPTQPLSWTEAEAAVDLVMRCASLVELVMAERCLRDLDDLTPDEVEAFIEDLQEDAESTLDKLRADLGLMEVQP